MNKIDNTFTHFISKKFNKKQISALLKKSFFFSESQYSYFQQIESNKQFDNKQSVDNEMMDIYVSKNISNGILKVKVNISKIAFDPADDRKPQMNYINLWTYYLLVHKNGIVEIINEIKSNEEDLSYLYIDLDELEFLVNNNLKPDRQMNEKISSIQDKLQRKMRNKFKKELNDINFLIDMEKKENHVNEDLLKKLKKEKSAIERKLIAKGEVKTKIFYNPYIYTTYSDYIIGGFKKEQLNRIKTTGDESELNFSKIECIVEERIKDLIKKEQNDTEKYLRKQNSKVDPDELEYLVNQDIIESIKNYFDYSTHDCQTWSNDPFSLIINSVNYINWLDKIKNRIEEYKNRIDYSILDVNENIPSDVELNEAEDATNQVTFLELIEKIADYS